jgi:hypothetical protein
MPFLRPARLFRFRERIGKRPLLSVERYSMGLSTDADSGLS